MTVNEDFYIDKLNVLLSESKTNNLFGKSYLYDNLDKICVDYLKYRGFIVPNKIKYTYNITKIDQLIDIFYLNLYKYHPDNIKLYRDKVEDRRSATAFVKSRQTASGTSRKEALSECATIVYKFFEYEEFVGFSGTISLSIFSVRKLRWVVDKILIIMNDKMKEYNEKKLELKKNRHEEASNKLINAKNELKEANESFKQISSSFKKAKHDYDKKNHTIMKTLESDLAFALKAKAKEIKHIDKKIQAYNKIK